MSSNRLFLILIFISILLIIWGSTTSGERFQLASARIMSLLQRPIFYSISILDARRENITLRKKLVEVTIEKELLKSFKVEIVKLKELLSFKNNSSNDVIAAEVISISPYPNEGIILINKGYYDGIKKGMVCITAQGLLGVVIGGDKDISEIETLNEQGFTASAMDSRTRAVGILRQKNGLYLYNVPLSSSINSGDTIITSGLGGIFPKGLPIGTIKDIKKSQDMLFYIARVSAFVPSVVEYVFIIEDGASEEVLRPPTAPRVKIEKPIKSERPAIEPIIPEPKIRDYFRKNE